MKILITGGAGYIGSHTNKLLNRQGYDTVVFDSLVRGHREFVKWGEFILGDIADKKLIRQVFSEKKIDAVIHFAAFAYVGESVSDPGLYYTNNVLNTINLLDAMREYGINKLIFSSTCATYGIPNHIPLTENHPQNPINPYGMTKLMIERILKDYDVAYNLKSICLRYFNAAGADPEGEIGEWHDPEPHLIPNILRVAEGKNEHMNIWGTDYDTKDGTCIRDYIHVNDLAKAHVCSLEKLCESNESNFYNLGTGVGSSVKDIIQSVEKTIQRKICYLEKPRRPGDPAILVSEYKKALKEINWAPQYSDLNFIIETAWNWQKTR